MSRFAVSGWTRRALVVLVSFSILVPSLVLPVAHAQQTATLQGVILDPSGRPAPGFKVVYKDVVSGTEYTSATSTAAGEYSLQVPIGSRYQLVNAVAPDGTRLPIQAGAPLPVRAGGVYRRDVQFQLAGGAQVVEQKPPAPEAAPPTPPPPTVTAAKTPPPAKPGPVTKPAPASQARTGAKKPWWKTTGGVIGIILGAGAIAAAAAGGGGGGGGTSSPSNP
ncbi:MAG: carboxypeptidase-like regulatory domain-containing protein [Acidobacteriia bacterium]|nr:carboxypeptidase-like regulatory domain-containing protein [Terriglobia bacterium]